MKNKHLIRKKIDKSSHLLNQYIFDDCRDMIGEIPRKSLQISGTKQKIALIVQTIANNCRCVQNSGKMGEKEQELKAIKSN